jgi:hypothetical protein
MEVCVSGPDGAAVCASTTSLTFTMTVTDARLKASMERMDSNAEAAIIEMIRRYCEQAANNQDCDLYAQQVSESLYIYSLEWKGEDATVGVEFADVKPTANRRALLSSDSSSFVEAAVSDAYAQGGSSSVTGPAGSSSAPVTAPSMVLAILMALAFAFSA